MKHNLKITFILMGMFVLTQIIGLLVVNSYIPTTQSVFNETSGTYQNVTVNPLPNGFQPPEPRTQVDFWTIFFNIIIAFVIAIVLMVFLSRIRIAFFLKFWFFVVVVIAIGLTLNSLLLHFAFLKKDFIPEFISYSFFISLVVAIPLAIYKIYRRNLIIHNLTELIVYPGIASIFVALFSYKPVPFVNVIAIFFFLILISVYDMWAVWKSGIMQKMAKFQMNEMKIFAGFFVPYLTSKVRAQISKLKKSKLKNKKIMVNLAILGGGDVVFPIITSGVFLKFYGIVPALLVVLGATVGLFSLFLISQKKKFYPAMPFITAGIFIAAGIWMIFHFLI